LLVSGGSCLKTLRLRGVDAFAGSAGRADGFSDMSRSITLPDWASPPLESPAHPARRPAPEAASLAHRGVSAARPGLLTRTRAGVALFLGLLLLVHAARTWHLSHVQATDFLTFYSASSDALAGRNPYAEVSGRYPYLYPPLLFWLCSPLTALPFALAAQVWNVLIFAAWLGALALSRAIAFPGGSAAAVSRWLLAWPAVASYRFVLRCSNHGRWTWFCSWWCSPAGWPPSAARPSRRRLARHGNSAEAVAARVRALLRGAASLATAGIAGRLRGALARGAGAHLRARALCRDPRAVAGRQSSATTPAR